MASFYEFWIKILYFKKKNYQSSFETKLLPSKVVRLGHVGDNRANADVLNNGFSIILNSIATVMDSSFTIFKMFNCRCPEQQLHHIYKKNIIIIIIFYIKTYLKFIETEIFII